LIGTLLRRIFVSSIRDLKGALPREGSAASERLLDLSTRIAREIKSLAIVLPIWVEFHAVASHNESI
jgi:hypothetical protein